MTMYCPQCRYEYQEGVTRCPDCNVELVAELPPEDTEEYVEYTEILSTYNPADVATLKSVLDEENITYYIHGENFNALGSMLEPSRIMVKNEEVEDAKELIAGLNLSGNAINVGSADDLSEEMEEEKL